MTGATREFRREFGAGWRFLLGAFVGIGGGFASLYFYSAGLFIKPLSAQFGWSRQEASLVAIAFMIGNVFALPFTGRLVDRFGEAKVALLSSFGLAATFAMLGLFTSNLVTFLSFTLLLTLVSAGTNSVSYNRVVVRHFVANRGLALGLALMGTGVGAIILPPVLGPYIATHGWRAAYLALAVATLVLSGIAWLLLRETPDRRGVHIAREPLPFAEILRNRSFYSVSALIFLSSTAVLGTTLHLVPMLTDRGVSAVEAGAIASVLGMSVIGGRLVAGVLLDRWDAGWVTFLLLTFAAFGALMLRIDSPGLAIAGAALIGFGVGTETDLLAYLLGRRFPIKGFSSVYGSIFAVHAFGAGIGGMAAGALFDATGSYETWLIVAAGGLFGAALIAFMTERGAVPVQVG
ncbi:MFS transporter [Croceicoccus bisphenolivorans]|uniref:MFS transporter n=1 Tax=Croceicoccus bisphenolivorans TaxID=1783232 RepID=UPI000834FE02|nr:MFS transporter [Croceicoccus bisphenolivorans]